MIVHTCLDIEIDLPRRVSVDCQGKSDFLGRHKPGEVFKGTIVSSFGIRRKTAGR
jgi:hypothetical protein